MRHYKLCTVRNGMMEEHADKLVEGEYSASP